MSKYGTGATYGVAVYGSDPIDPPLIIAEAISISPSERFFAEIRQSHIIACEADLLTANGTVIGTLAPVEGTVTLDAKAAVRGTLDATFAGNVAEATDPLAPYGNEIQVKRGVLYSDGTTELLNLGIFRIDEVDVIEDESGVSVHVTGQDRAVKVSDAKFEEPYNIPKGTFFTEAIRTLIENAIGEFGYNFVESSITTPALFAEEGDDPWEFAQGLATALGAELFFDRDGNAVLQPIPRPVAEASVWELEEGEGGLLVTTAKHLTRIDAFNKVIVANESSDSGVGHFRGEAWDDNPDSPTYYYGPFGKVPKFYSNPYITTQAQADDAADGILAAELGIAKNVDFGTVTNPWLSVSDVIKIKRSKLGIDEYHVIDNLVIPLDAEQPMTGTTRSVHVVG